MRHLLGIVVIECKIMTHFFVNCHLNFIDCMMFLKSISNNCFANQTLSELRRTECN